jgi:hypothetical protein
VCCCAAYSQQFSNVCNNNMCNVFLLVVLGGVLPQRPHHGGVKFRRSTHAARTGSELALWFVVSRLNKAGAVGCSVSSLTRCTPHYGPCTPWLPPRRVWPPRFSCRQTIGKRRFRSVRTLAQRLLKVGPVSAQRAGFRTHTLVTARRCPGRP